MNNKFVIGFVRFSIILEKDKGAWFSSRELDWDEHIKQILDSSRLKSRLKLFRYSLTQLNLQTHKPDPGWFRLIVFISTMLNGEFKKELYEMQKEFTWLTFIERSPQEGMGADLSALSLLKEIKFDNKKIPVLTFRLDDDDFLSINYLQKIIEYCSEEYIDKVVTFPHGYKCLWNPSLEKILQLQEVRRPFIAIGLSAISCFNAEKGIFESRISTVFTGINHKQIPDHFNTIIDDSECMYVWSHHSDQDTFGRFKSEIMTEANHFVIEKNFHTNFPALNGKTLI